MNQAGLLAMSGSLLGGIGLFMLGLWLMTGGLKRAAGRSLQAVLARGTGTPLRGLAAGFAVTALVQSSSAVTVATIGFVNAGLLNLSQAVWVIFGSNVGTTMTSWLVALVGLKLEIGRVALPLIGIGMLLRLTGSDRARGAWGEALAGFGCFFAGIGALQEGFAVLGGMVGPQDLPAGGWGGRLIFLGFGMLLTALTQSSSAASAITVAAVAGGSIPLEAAAAAVIGANLGTTVTAVLAVIGATPNARRSAAAHVIFNLVTAAVAFLILPLLVAATRRASGDDPALATALFHSLFNLLGVLLLAPAVSRLVVWLHGRFRSAGEDLARPQFLDATAAVVPALALGSLRLELQRLGGIALGLALGPATGRATGPEQAMRREAALALGDAIKEFALQLNRGDLSEPVARTLPDVLRAAQHYQAIAAAGGDDPGPGAEDFLAACRAALVAADTQRPEFSLPAAIAAAADCDAAYQQFKAALLQKAGPALPAARLDRQLMAAASLRDAAIRAMKAARRLAPLLPPAGQQPPPADAT